MHGSSYAIHRGHRCSGGLCKWHTGSQAYIYIMCVCIYMCVCVCVWPISNMYVYARMIPYIYRNGILNEEHKCILGLYNDEDEIENDCTFEERLAINFTALS